jgi:RNA polymerase sigma factor for flagellar operon FliA
MVMAMTLVVSETTETFADAAGITSELWERYKSSGDLSAREKLILQYGPLVKYVVGRMAIGLPGVLSTEDLNSHATIGLIDAIERFDPGRGLKFESYAIARLRGSVVDVVRRLGATPRGARRKMRDIDSNRVAMEEQNGRTPTTAEAAAYMGISVVDYEKTVRDASLSIVSLDQTSATADDDDALSLAETLEDLSSPNPQLEAETSEIRAALRQAVVDLPERDRQLIALYYIEELTLKEIGQVLGVSESRVCQLHTRAVSRLRSALGQSGITRAA